MCGAQALKKAGYLNNFNYETNNNTFLTIKTKKNEKVLELVWKIWIFSNWY